MTAQSFAELIQARRAGAAKWQARCPAHEDRSPSLSITEGRDGRALILCRAGCNTQDILAALCLSMRDLFAGPPATPQQAAVLAAERNVRTALDRQQRAKDRTARDRVYRLGKVVNAIGAKLARRPDDAALGKLFHTACDCLHESETICEQRERPASTGLERIA